jgi:leucyl aminopeptidase
MEIRAIDTLPLNWTGDTLAIGLFEEQTDLVGELEQLNEKLAGTIAELISETEFKGKNNEIAATRVGSNMPIRKIILVGLGKTEGFKLNNLRTAGAAIARSAKQQKTKTLAVSLSAFNNNFSASARAIVEGLLLALHQDTRFKSESNEKNGLKLENIEILGLGDQSSAIALAEKVVSGVILARELVAAPANAVTPITMAETATEIAANGMSLQILEKEDCEKLNMGAFLGVAMASDLPPKFIHLTYKPQGEVKRKLAIVGKSLTFDSGGLNIKGVGSGIETMKMDMGGGAATLGAAKAIAQIQPVGVEVHFICAATENMISGHAMHPGDILTASNGKTIEVNNTDAEGRLTLADALVYAEKLEVDAIVDLATLTGACVIALGDDIAGLWSPNEELAQEFTQAAERAGEKFWQMPLEERYFEGLKSPIADMKNTGPRAGGSITAALFLKQFIKETPWVHLDIAGPVWADKDNGFNNAGATGFAVRTLVNWVLN